MSSTDGDGISRRSLLAGVAAFGAGLSLAPRHLSGAEAPKGAVNIVTSAEALERLRAGNERFTSGAPLAPRRDLAHLRTLAPNQAPFAAVLGCADSRVPIEVIYDQGFGDLFVVRVAGNVATSVEIASLEYGTIVLGASVLIVLGHSNCGAVKAALAGGDVPGQISTLYQHIAPPLDRKTMDLDDAIAANVRYQARKLISGSTVIPNLRRDGKLVVLGGVFELKTGTVVPVEL